MSTPIWVTVDDSRAYPAQSIAETRWNGFACPFFTRETVERIARDFTRDEFAPRVSFDSDALVLTYPEYSDEPERIEPSPDGTYALGAFKWCWSVVEHNEYPHHPGYLYDCTGCETFCHCTPGATECVFDGAHNGAAS